MTTIPQPEKKTNQWWHTEHLIAGLDATPTEKYLLTLVHLHTNKKTGRAWASQETLAAEACTDLRTVERFFAKMKRLGVTHVQRIRKGKRPSDQYNEYWLNTERLKQLQRTEHPSPLSGDDTAEHPTPMSPNTRHLSTEHPTFDAGTPDTHVEEGFEVKQAAIKSREQEATPAAQTAADVTGEFSSLPVWIPLREWQEFLKCRKRKPSDFQVRLLIERLAELRDDGNDPVAVLNQSIIGGYPSLYPMRNPQNGQYRQYSAEEQHQRNIKAAKMLGLDRHRGLDLRGLSYEELDAIDNSPPFGPNRTARQKLARSLKNAITVSGVKN